MKNLKIRTQLILGFGLIFIFVLILGYSLIVQTTRIEEQTTLLYNHPVRVRNAISDFQKNVLLIHRDMKSMMLTDDPDEVTQLIALTESYQANAFQQLDILYDFYLGPPSDIDHLRNEFIYWNSIREETIRLLLSGQEEEAAMRTQSYGVGGKQADVVINAILPIDQFSRNKTEEFYQNAQRVSHESNLQSVIMVSIIIVLMLGVYYLLFTSMRNPLREISSAANHFMAGELDARSQFFSGNEFGELSKSFNEMADTIQQNFEVINKREKFSNLLMTEIEIKHFFSIILQEFIQQTESQVGVVYRLDEGHQEYVLFDSLGMDGESEKSFSAATKEGEFGLVLATKEIHHLTEIGENNRYQLKTAFGDFLPNEIITIPLIIEDRIPLIISLATLSNFSPQTLRFVNETWKLLNARITGLLAMEEIQQLAQKLELQNKELDAQTTELLSQSIELNQQNIELELQKNQLGQANQMKTSFISNMSHELRTPLNSIIALSGVLSRHLENKIPEDEFSYLEVIERNGKQLLDLINDILDISRIESGREELEISKFNLRNLLTEIISVLSPIAEQKNLKISQSIPDDLSEIVSDDKKCRHIFQNIISNAIKFTEEGLVSMVVLEKTNQFIVEVQDTGIGIAEHDLARIFEEFRQADESTRRRFGGTGLGLSIAKKYAEMIGGTISVTSTVGIGSVFRIHLPKDIYTFYPGKNQLIRDLTSERVIIPSITIEEKSKLRIMIVEDSEPAMIQLQDILSNAGYQTLFAKDGREALEIIFVTKPDAIILDLMMPEVDGFEVLQTIRNDDRTVNIPVLVLTAKTITKEELSFLKRNHIYQLIQKGAINRTELITAIDNMLTSTIQKSKQPKNIPMVQPKEKATVLVVEDNPDNLLTVKALLQYGFNVIEAIDGEIGLHLAKTRHPDLILLDIALPKMDGIQVIKAIKADIKLANIKIIALTASVMTKDRESILSHGFDGFIPKPIDHTKFIHTIRQILYGE